MTTSNTWQVYLLRCNDNSLYAGITTDIQRRLKQHNNSKLGAKYTRARRPVEIAYVENASDRSTASKREYYIRTMTKMKKEQLVNQYAIEQEVC
jgi:putative endonuclease